MKRVLTSDDHVRLAIAKSARYRRYVTCKLNEKSPMEILRTVETNRLSTKQRVLQTHCFSPTLYLFPPTAHFWKFNSYLVKHKIV